MAFNFNYYGAVPLNLFFQELLNRNAVYLNISFMSVLALEDKIKT